MTIPKASINCDRFADRLSDYLERDVDEPTRASMDAAPAGAPSAAACSPIFVRCAWVRRVCRSSSRARGLSNGIARANRRTPVILMRGQQERQAVQS